LTLEFQDEQPPARRVTDLEQPHLLCLVEKENEEKCTYQDGSKGYRVHYRLRFYEMPDRRFVGGAALSGKFPPSVITRPVNTKFDEYGEEPDWKAELRRVVEE